MSRILADIKWMPLSNQGFNYILFATCKISNCMIDIHIQRANVVTIAIAEAFTQQSGISIWSS